MKNMIKGLGVASVLALGSASFAHADMTTMMQGYAACNTGYAQCLAAADTTLAMSPAEGMNKMQMNMQHAQLCGQALQACYASVQ